MVFTVSQVPASAGEFRVGYAQVDITPERALPMWGYGARHALLSRGCRDPLWAKCVLIAAGDRKAALVGLDLGRSPGDPHFSRIRAAVKREAGVDFVLISGSHTHHGPVLELRDLPGQGGERYPDAVAYVDELERKLTQVICLAADSLQDARIGWSSRHVDMNRNRHAKIEPKPCDSELAVVRLDDASGKPLAVIVNFAAHPTMLSADDLRWSAEYPGVMMETVQEQLGVPCLFLQGAAGDLSIKSRPEDHLSDDDPSLDAQRLDQTELAVIQETLQLSDEEAAKRLRERIAADHRMQSVGRRLGAEVVQIARECATHVPAAPGMEGNDERFAFASRVELTNPAVRLMFAVAFFPELAEAVAAEHLDNLIRPRLTTLLLNGELALIGGSGEFFTAHGLHLKQRLHSAKVLFVGYCNGHDMYFPTIEAAAQGGYGADPQVAWAELGAGEQMMNRALINIFTWQGNIKTGLNLP